MSFYPSGQLKEKIVLKDGITMEARTWFENGYNRMTSQTSGDTTTKYCRFKSGGLKSHSVRKGDNIVEETLYYEESMSAIYKNIEYYPDGSEHKIECFSPDGKLTESKQWDEDGKMHGRWIVDNIDPSGKEVSVRREYEHGTPVGTHVYKNYGRHVLKEVSFQDGKKHGPVKSIYPVIAKEGCFKNGVRVGVWTKTRDGFEFSRKEYDDFGNMKGTHLRYNFVTRKLMHKKVA